MDTVDMTPYYELAAAIVIQAIEDVTRAYRAYKHCPCDGTRMGVRQAERWFATQWCEELLHGVTTGDRIIYELRKRMGIDADL